MWDICRDLWAVSGASPRENLVGCSQQGHRKKPPEPSNSHLTVLWTRCQIWSWCLPRWLSVFFAPMFFYLLTPPFGMGLYALAIVLWDYRICVWFLQRFMTKSLLWVSEEIWTWASKTVEKCWNCWDFGEEIMHFHWYVMLNWVCVYLEIKCGLRCLGVKLTRVAMWCKLTGSFDWLRNPPGAVGAHFWVCHGGVMLGPIWVPLLSLLLCPQPPGTKQPCSTIPLPRKVAALEPADCGPNLLLCSSSNNRKTDDCGYCVFSKAPHCSHFLCVYHQSNLQLLFIGGLLYLCFHFQIEICKCMIFLVLKLNCFAFPT